MLMNASLALERRFELPDAPGLEKGGGERRFLGLRIGNLGLLVAPDLGGEIIEDVRVFPLPRAAAWCRGLINLRGHLIPAFDLHESLGLTHFRASRQWWFALGTGSDTLAFPVDALPVSLVANESSVVRTQQVLQAALGAHAGQTFRINGDLWLEFQHRAFFRSRCAPAPGYPSS
jgi:chemotaxis signal transduction protein